jgi:hypothetical protein
VQKTPFSVLDIPPDADLDVARSRYRKLAREHHPDSSACDDKRDATRVMAELNWAMEELERDPERWRARIGAPIEVIHNTAASKPPVSVSPTLALLNNEDAFVAYVTAAAPGVDAASIRLRYASDVIEVERLPSFGGVANFRIGLAHGVREVATPRRERLELRARGCKPVVVSVAVEPFTALEPEAMSAKPGSNPPVWPWFAAASAALTAVAGLLLFAI